MGFKSITATVAAVLLLAGCSPGEPEALPYQDTKLPFEKRVEDLLSRLSAAEKHELLQHSPGITTHPIWRLGIPGIKSRDLGRNAMAMAAAWDPDLVSREAREVADEAIAANRREVIGPDLADFGEDPWLASRLAVAWVSALQGEGVIATLKGFGRGDEIAQFPYEAAIEEAGLWAIEPAAGDPSLANALLKEDGGFRGFVAGAATDDDETEQARRRLRAMFGIGIFDVDTRPPGGPAPNRNESVVLMRNEGHLLPLASSVRSIVVIGGTSLAIPAECHATVSYASPAEAVSLARKSEIAVIFGNDLTLIQAVAAANPKTIAVLGRPARITGQVPAVLAAWGRRDIGPFLFGQINPSGKLPIGLEPQFAFGSGLSYSEFTYSDLNIFPKTPRYGELVQVVVKIKNTGSRPGAEVAEVYVQKKL
ncbi:MAG: glycoside hydrolase family 3 C-terminal domain-containing protein, partial [Terriglobia bacterium]